MRTATAGVRQTPPPPPPAPPVLRRLVTPWPERRTVHIAPERWRCEPLAALLARAEELQVRTLILVAGPYAHKAQRPPRDWWLAPTAQGWAIHNYLGDPPRATYRRAAAVGEIGGERTTTVDVVTSAPWFGAAMDADAVRHAWKQLGRLCRGSFDSFAALFSTPARTGLDLMQRTLPKGAEYPVAPPDILQLLHANSGQGRMQFLPTAAGVSDLYWLDARWQYAGCVSNLPRGPLHLDRRPDYIPHVPAFYLARWRSPSSWPHSFGLLPELTGDDDDGPRFHYPIDSTHWHTGWVTGVELELAREQGWDVRISERMWWGMTGPDPLRNGHTGWSDTLRTLREHSRNELVNAAVRHLLIDTVGAWHRQARRELHITPLAEAERTIPAGRAYGLVVRGDVVEWFSDAPLAEALAPMQHPEWAWQVWGRSRVHTLRAALRYLAECPGGEVAAFRSDCIVVTRDPGWLDNGKVGTFRRKRHLQDVAVPRDEPAYRELLALDDATAAELDDELTAGDAPQEVA